MAETKKKQQPTKQRNASAKTAEWPGAFGIFNRSREAIRRNFSTFIALLLFMIIISLLTSGRQTEGSLNLRFQDIASYLASVWASIALIVAILASLRDETISAIDALRDAAGFYVRALGLTILTTLIIIGSLIALVIPFFFIFPRITLAPYFLVDQNLGPIEALKASWEATRGHVSKVWGIVLAQIVFAVLIIVLVGFYLTFMYLAAEGLLYLYLTQRQTETKK
jgi:hypothetical protein